MQIVTLTTDWGTKDFFSGMVKAKLYSNISDVQVVDITHDIEPYNLSSTAFVVKNACLNFPKGTIHIIDVNSFIGDSYFVVVEYKEQYFICTDNKMPYSVFGDECTNIIEVDTHWEANFYNFAAHDLFCKVAIMIANGTPLDEIGYKHDSLKKSQSIGCIYDNNSIRASIMYIDSYGNAYLNVTYEKFKEISKGRKCIVSIRSEKHAVEKLFSSYDEQKKESQIILTVSSTGYIELALKIASAEQLLGLRVREQVLITFID
ncbi:MAG: SAM-dependent chlorinase/fluorinase [Bacteroidales bacterium]|nr:SAM-dependent chlorinase/fluorinase [Bacteroidales bacterium]